ncbi:MAG: glycosyltransferase [Lachnospiraceae bacterium]|nr:glycosyltransferase [Lachnospiraceae bacterium]
MNRDGVKISIIVPCYKVEKYLRRAMDALLSQTMKEIEIVCINDGSPDGCLDILRGYEQEDERVIVIDKPNEGVWAARLDGVKRSSGEYIGFADPDDYVKSDFAESLYRAAEKYDADIACCGFDRVDSETGRTYSREMTKFRYDHFDMRKEPGLMLEVNAAIWNKIFRRSLFSSMGQIPKVPGALDDMIFAQLLYVNAGRIAFVNRALVSYTVRADSIISTISPELIPGIYDAMHAARRVFESENPSMLVYFDSNAFLHLGISLMHRLSADRGNDMRQLIRRNIAELDAHFPLWRRSPYIRLSYVLSHRLANLKLFIIRRIYGFGAFNLFLKVYGAMINGLGIDIKW